MNTKLKTVPNWLVLLPLCVMLTNCAPAEKKRVPTVSDTETRTVSRLPDSIARLKEIARKDPDKARRADAYLKLAKFYSSHKNPNPDYAQALKELEAYIALNPTEGKSDEIQDWLVLLREIERVNESSQQRLNQLTKENKELKDMVEALKHLDIRMEEKRKQMK